MNWQTNKSKNLSEIMKICNCCQLKIKMLVKNIHNCRKIDIILEKNLQPLLTKNLI